VVVHFSTAKGVTAEPVRPAIAASDEEIAP